MHLWIQRVTWCRRTESPTVLSGPSAPPSSPPGYLTFSAPFILQSSVAEWETGRSTSPPVNRRQTRTSPAQPLGAKRFSQFSTWQSNYVLELSRSRLNRPLTTAGEQQTQAPSGRLGSSLGLCLCCPQICLSRTRTKRRRGPSADTRGVLIIGDRQRDRAEELCTGSFTSD